MAEDVYNFKNISTVVDILVKNNSSLVYNFKNISTVVD